MPRLNKEFKEQIKNLRNTELQEIVLKLASKEQFVFDYIFANYLDIENGEQDLFEKTKADLELLFWKSYKGFSEQLQIANMLGACIKRINEFSRISKNKVLEADLLMYILEILFSHSPNMFGTCFTQYDSKVAIIVRRLMNIVTKKIHEDYRIEYQTEINEYLKILHLTSNHIDTVYNLPKAI